MSKQKKYLAIIAAVLLVAGTAYWLYLEEARHIPPETAEPEIAAAQISYMGNALQEEKNGKKIWELKAEIIEVDPTTKNMTMKNIKGIFYQDADKTVTIEAPKAFYDITTKDIIVSEGVKAASSDGAVLNADEVIFDHETEVFTGNGHVKYVKNDTIMTGDKIDALAAFTKFVVTGNAHIIKGGQAS